MTSRLHLVICALLVGLSPLAWAVDPPLEPDASPAEAVEVYVATALQDSPQVAAAHARWQASMAGVARARGLPEPTVSLGVFVQSVETRVGPQLGKVGLQQMVPWPGALIAGGDVASAEARAALSRLDAVSLAVRHQVHEAYWSLWEIRRTRDTHRAHLAVLQGLSSTLGARVEVGSAGLADLQQVDLSRARLADSIASMDAREQGAKARLHALVGAIEIGGLKGPGEAVLPEHSALALTQRALAAPSLDVASANVDAADARVRMAKAQRLPGFTVGADWILVGPSPMPDVENSGKDAVAVGLGLKLPLWQGRYARQVSGARAYADAASADLEHEQRMVQAAVVSREAEVRDSARRLELARDTLLPQAEATYASLLGAYSVGGGTVAQVLMAQQDLLALRVALDRARADHARAWAALDELCGGGLAAAAVEEAE